MLRKIINDPVYGFITISDPLILELIAHPWYQRLRRIYQMAFAHLVYPGAMHSRLHHSLGAYHLMGCALSELKSKGVDITNEEVQGAQIAILLHDAGHGPYSHTLEKELIPGAHHEDISLQIMKELNREYGGKLETAIAIFTNTYPKPFLHQLVSGQLDVDRMDYLSRDSFFTGVAEGVIGYDRILKMLAVHEGNLVVEEKGVYSIEKFLVARRLMYWQVYLHKTVLSAEMTLVMILRRARQLSQRGMEIKAATSALDFYLQFGEKKPVSETLDVFCQLDDFDVMCTVKNWSHHPDKVLSLLSSFLVDRKLLKIAFQAEPPSEQFINEKRKEAMKQFQISEEEAGYLVFGGEATNITYDSSEERICILFKDGTVRDISEVDNALIHQQLSSAVKKFYICYPGGKKA